MLEYIDGVIVRDEEFDNPQVDEDYPDCKRLLAVPFHSVSREELEEKRLLFSLKDAKSIPLSELPDMKITRCNQTIGDFLGMQNSMLIDEHLNPTIYLSEGITMQGKITGLSDIDMERFREENVGGGNYVANAIMKYLETGSGLDDTEDVEVSRLILILMLCAYVMVYLYA